MAIKILSAMNEKQINILVTGTNADKYCKLGNVIHTPLIEIKGKTDNTDLENKIDNIQKYDWVIFTSKYAVHYFFKILFESGEDSRTLAGLQIASIGKTTSEKLLTYGIIPDLQSKNQSSKGLINQFIEEKIEAAEILIPRSNIALDTLPNGLTTTGHNVTTITAYKNVMPKNVQIVDLSKIDKIVFSSPSCVKNFVEIYKTIPKHPKITCKGNETQKTYQLLINN